MYEAEFYEELPEGATIEKEIEVIVLQLLRDFSFLKTDEEYHDVDDIDEDSCKEKLATENTQNEQSNLHNLKSNYFSEAAALYGSKICRTEWRRR